MRLIRGDCLEVLPTLDAASVDLILADLPYQVTACSWDAIIPFAPMWEGFRHVLKPAGAVVLTASQPFTSSLVMSNPKWFRHEWIWHKGRGSNFANTCREPFKEHESVIVFSPGKWTYIPQMQERNAAGLARARCKYSEATIPTPEHYGKFTKSRTYTGTERFPSSVQRINKENGLHPSQKPVALMAYLIRTYTNPGDTVLDPTCGSGSTGVACIQERRDFIGIEKDAGYFAVAQDRLKKAAAQELLPLFDAGEADA